MTPYFLHLYCVTVGTFIFLKFYFFWEEMIMKMKKLLFVCSISLIIAGTTACGGSNSTSSASKETVFAFYDKVDLNQTKQDIDATLGVTPEANEMLEGTYDYYDEATGFGVTVLYDGDEAIAKTVIITSAKDLAPFCKTTVKEAQLSEIANDITYDDTVKILGGDGVEFNATEMPFADNKIGKMYRWVNKDGSGIWVTYSVDNTVTGCGFFDKDSY